LKEQLEQVKEFHEHMNITPRHDWPNSFEPALNQLGLMLDAEARDALKSYNNSKDVRWLRVHLLMEELAEVIIGLASCKKVDVLDGLADLSYVTLGTAAVFELPLPEAFEEVHRSNMTKKPSDQRCSDKTGYTPPNLKKLL
jgi:predicted HAD superfamily Cof-like phosphohydrolase